MTKADLARVVYERHGGLSNKEASRLVDLILAFIKQGLREGERVQISGFGTFLVREKKERKGRNRNGRGNDDTPAKIGRLPSLQEFPKRLLLNEASR